MRVTRSGISAGFPGEEHVLQHLKPESKLRSKKADGGCVFGGPCHEDAGCAGRGGGRGGGVSGGGALARCGVCPLRYCTLWAGGFGICSRE